MWEQPHTPWITCWIALDDVSESNGTIYVLPHTRSEHSDAAIGSLEAVTPHELATDGSNDLIGYSGGEEGVPVEMKAGGMAVFSSTTFHRSGRNASGDVRRACESPVSLIVCVLVAVTFADEESLGLAGQTCARTATGRWS